MDANLITLIAVVAGLALVAVLYRAFYRERNSGGTDELNWVNDSNYNIATSNSEEAAIASASPREAAEIVEAHKANGPYPPSDSEFHDLNEQLGQDGKTSQELREELKHA